MKLGHLMVVEILSSLKVQGHQQLLHLVFFREERLLIPIFYSLWMIISDFIYVNR